MKRSLDEFLELFEKHERARENYAFMPKGQWLTLDVNGRGVIRFETPDARVYCCPIGFVALCETKNYYPTHYFIQAGAAIRLAQGAIDRILAAADDSERWSGPLFDLRDRMLEIVKRGRHVSG